MTPLEVLLKAKKQTRQPAEVTRLQLLDATEKLMIAEGYAAVTTRRVGAAVGLTGPLVHYYYPTTEDLLVAARRRAAARHENLILSALESEYPLHAIWNLMIGTQTQGIALGLEFGALANHRKSIRSEIAKHDILIRQLQARKLSRMMPSTAGKNIGLTPLGAVMLLEGIARTFAIDRNFRLSFGHSEARNFIETILDVIEPIKKKRQRKTTSVRRSISKQVKSAS